jgi:hypothetical protein
VANEKKDKEIKVTDKRMFTPDGKLREEYRFLDEKSTEKSTAEPAAPTHPVAPPPAAETRRPEPPPQWEPQRPADPLPRVDLPPMPEELDAPSFFDLVAMLAEPVPIYLGDARLPDGQSAENLDTARFYIDLMDVLRQKTAGNLTAQESAFLEDLLYRLRVRYVQKSRG